MHPTVQKIGHSESQGLYGAAWPAMTCSEQMVKVRWSTRKSALAVLSCVAHEWLMSHALSVFVLCVCEGRGGGKGQKGRPSVRKLFCIIFHDAFSACAPKKTQRRTRSLAQDVAFFAFIIIVILLQLINSTFPPSPCFTYFWLVLACFDHLTTASHQKSKL